MRSLSTSPLYNSHFQLLRGGRCITESINWSRSAFNRILATSLMLAMFAVTAAPVYGGATSYSIPPAQGSSARKTVIDVRTPPVVYLPGPTFSIQVTSLKPVSPRVIDLLQQSIERTLLKNDSRLTPAQAPANTSIKCTITDFAASSRVESGTTQQYQKIGDTTITDPTTGMSRTEDVYGYVDVPYRTLAIEGRMSVKCEVKDTATGILLYEDLFNALYTEAQEAGYGTGAMSADFLNLLYLKLAENAAGLILNQLSPGGSSEIVVLSSGKLKEASKMLEAGRWAEALTLLSSVPVFKDPKDDAYRLYSIGVAHYALAYNSLDPFVTKLQLERAVDNYRRAAELKPNEDIFWGPKYRAEAALLQTNGLVVQVEAFEEAKRVGSNPTNDPDRVAAGNADLFHRTRARVQSAPSVINNQTVIQWVKSGRSEDYIAASIKHAPRTQFDLSEAEVLKLRREGVNKNVLRAMTWSKEGYRSGSLTKTVIATAAMLWWLPFLFR